MPIGTMEKDNSTQAGHTRKRLRETVPERKRKN